MWPGPGCIIGGKGSSQTSAYGNSPGNVPTLTSADGIWRPDDASYYLNNGFYGLEWPTLPDPNFANVLVNWHCDRKGTGQGNMRMLPPSRAAADCDGFEQLNQAVAGMAQHNFRVFGLYSFLAVNSCNVVHNINNAITLGSSDITAEGWIYQQVASVTGTFWDFRQNLSDTIRPSLGLNTGKLRMNINGVDVILAAATMSLNTWHHFAWCRDTGAGNSYLYLDGVSVGSVADARNYGTTNTCRIGTNSGGTNPGATYQQEYRCTVGTARYPGGTTFTVPAVPFPDY